MSTGKVTREHREAAFAAMGCAEPSKAEYVDRYLRTGLDTADPPVFPITSRVAQAIADAGARGTAKASALVEAERALVEAAMAWADGGTKDGPLENAIRRVRVARASSKGTP